MCKTQLPLQWKFVEVKTEEGEKEKQENREERRQREKSKDMHGRRRKRGKDEQTTVSSGSFVSWVHALSTGCFKQCQNFEGFMSL